MMAVRDWEEGRNRKLLLNRYELLVGEDDKEFWKWAIVMIA